MAARKNRVTLSDTWKERIKTGVIMERVQAHLMGEIELSSTQMSAAKLLLGKLIPDLNRTTVEGDPDKPLQNKITIEVVR